jgi:hypothetical protein
MFLFNDNLNLNWISHMVFLKFFQSKFHTKSEKSTPDTIPIRNHEGPDVSVFIFALPSRIKPSLSLHFKSLALHQFIDSSRDSISFRHIKNDDMLSISSLESTTPTSTFVITSAFEATSISTALINELSCTAASITIAQVSSIIIAIPPPPITLLPQISRLWLSTQKHLAPLHLLAGPTDNEKNDAKKFLASVRKGLSNDISPTIKSSFIVSIGETMSSLLIDKIKTSSLQAKNKDLFVFSEVETLAMNSDTPTTRQLDNTLFPLFPLPASIHLLNSSTLAPSILKSMFKWSKVHEQQLPQIPLKVSSLVNLIESPCVITKLKLHEYDAPILSSVKSKSVKNTRDSLYDFSHLPSFQSRSDKILGRSRSNLFSLPCSDLDEITAMNPLSSSNNLGCIQHLPNVGSASLYFSTLKKHLKCEFESTVNNAVSLSEKCSYTKQVSLSSGLISRMISIPVKDNDSVSDVFFIPFSYYEYQDDYFEKSEHNFMDVYHKQDFQEVSHQEMNHPWNWEQPLDSESSTRINKDSDNKKPMYELIPPSMRMPSPPEAQKNDELDSLAFKILRKKI